MGAAIEHIWHDGRLPRGLRITLLMWLLGELGPPGRRAWSDRRGRCPYRDEALYRLGTEMRPSFVPLLDDDDVIEIAGEPRLVGTGSDDAERPMLGPDLGLAFRIARAKVRCFDIEDCDRCLEDWQPDVLESLESLAFYFGHMRASDGEMAMEYWNQIRLIIRQGISGASNLRRLTIEACDAAIFEELTLALANAPFMLDEFKIKGVVWNRKDSDRDRATSKALAKSPALRGLRRLTVVPYGSYPGSNILPGIFVVECSQTLEVLKIKMFNNDRTSVSFVCFHANLRPMFEDKEWEQLGDTYELLARVTLPNLRVLAIEHICQVHYTTPAPENGARFVIPLDAMPSLRECYFNLFKCAYPFIATGTRPRTMDVFQIGKMMTPDNQGLV